MVNSIKKCFTCMIFAILIKNKLYIKFKINKIFVKREIILALNISLNKSCTNYHGISFFSINLYVI
jgi:hypothetical protein